VSRKGKEAAPPYCNAQACHQEKVGGGPYRSSYASSFSFDAKKGFGVQDAINNYKLIKDVK